MGEEKENRLQRDSKRDLCGGGTVLYLECGSCNTNLHDRITYYYTHTHTHISTCKIGYLNKVCEL